MLLLLVLLLLLLMLLLLAMLGVLILEQLEQDLLVVGGVVAAWEAVGLGALGRARGHLLGRVLAQEERIIHLLLISALMP